MIAHIVLFEPKPDVLPVDRQRFIDAIKRAAEGIPGIDRARIGKTSYFGVMPENNGGQKTYNYAAVFEFADKAALQAYLDHPLHVEVRTRFWEMCLGTLISDVELMDVDDDISQLLV